MEKIDHTETTVNGWIVRLMKKQDELVDWVTEHDKRELPKNVERIGTKHEEAQRSPGE